MPQSTLPAKLLLATDLSARCDRALDRAAALAAAWQVELVAVHALEQSDDFYTTDLERRLPSWGRLRDAARIAEEQLRQDMPQTGLSVSAIVEKAEPVELILRVARKEGCGLIVTGIARDETLGRFGLGTTVDRLLRQAAIPVLLVKQRARQPYRNILVATDFAPASRAGLLAAAALFPDRGLTLLHVHDAPMAGLASDPENFRLQHRQAALKAGANFLADAELSSQARSRIHLVVEHGSPGALIDQYARERDIDLVVIGSSNRGPLLDILIGGTAREMLGRMPCDMLLMPPPG